MTHGTSSAYTAGCRCQPCRTAHRNHVVAWQAKARTRTPPPHAHGTLNGYTNYRCRCDDCRAAMAAYQSEYRAR